MVIQLSEISPSEYPQFASKHSTETNYFNSVEWVKIYGNQIMIVGIFDEGSNYLGNFCLYLGQRFGQNYGITPPYSNTIGLSFKHSSTNKSSINSVYKQLHTAIADYFLNKNLLLLNVVFPLDFFDAQPYLWKDFETSLKYTYQLNLNQTIESIVSNFSTERRKNITKAQKDGITCQISYNFPLMYEMTHHTINTKRADADKDIVKNIYFDFAHEKNAFGFIAYKNNQPSAMVFCIHDQQSAYYLFGYSNKDNAHEGASAYAMIKAIEHSIKLNLVRFDFCGSMLPSVERYFRGFGADLVPMMQIVRASKKGKLLLRIKKRKITK
jgi:lipid II:glycine glycyltransferase (peptidoglycan interpeptide bridge formation enzyme)